MTDTLPFTTDDTDVHEGIGTVHRIIPLDRYTNATARVTDGGRCAVCGYDRGERVFHTEVGGERVTCRHCERPIYEVEP